MSTFLYGVRTRERERGLTALTEGGPAPGAGSPWVDTVAALVPAEVLAIHALALSGWSDTIPGCDGAAAGPDCAADGPVTAITNAGSLQITFFALIALCALLFALGKKSDWKPADGIRLFIPSAAFVVWTMAMPGSAFDAVVNHMDGTARAVIAGIAALLLVGVAKRLADEAES